ncbi:hypothetical protein AB833_10260 [Chromatiales bacterium (ex Bugula neritina AB1)]|nr:hypothetical protein AB833_10260 [Chromatiales bacterium (ex Bugula neritina AB1)]
MENTNSIVSAGALTLLRDCVGGSAGERLLIVSEPEGNNFYDDDAPSLTAIAARSLGMTVYETEAKSFIATSADTKALVKTLSGFDHVVFFSRLGDQIRFSENVDIPPATMCYTLNRESLNSAFGTACYHGLCEIKRIIDEAFLTARSIQVTCPRGTDYRGAPENSTQPPTEVTLKRFPMLVPQPVPCMGFSGKIALSRFLIGTGSRFYEPYFQPLPNDVTAYIEDNGITEFDGPADDVTLVENHYRHVASQFNIDPWYVHSWHAGMHPGCHFSQAAESDIIRWSGSAFGNPRLLHFHTCGNYAPGEISWNILDPTIIIDDIAVWENGCLHPERLPDSARVLDRHPNLVELYRTPVRDIGLAS